MLSSCRNRTFIKPTHPCCGNCINCYQHCFSKRNVCRFEYELEVVSDSHVSIYNNVIENPFCEICDNYVSKDTIQPLISIKSSAEMDVLDASGALAYIPKIYLVARKNFIIENFDNSIVEECNKATDTQIYSTAKLMRDIVYGDSKEEVPIDLLPLTCDFLHLANNDIEIRL